MTNKKFPLLPLIIGGAVLLLCCFVVGVLVVGGFLVSRNPDSTVPATNTPVEQTPTTEPLTPAIVLTSQEETTAAADGVPVTDSKDVAMTVPAGSLVDSDGVVMTSWLPPDTFTADLEIYGLERKSLLYSLQVTGDGENMGGADLSFPASSPEDRLAVLLDHRLIAVLGVTPQDGRLVVTAAVSPGVSFTALVAEGAGDAYFVVAGGASPQTRQPLPSNLTAGFSADLRPVAWTLGSDLVSSSQEAVCNTSVLQPMNCPLGIYLESPDGSIIFIAEDTPQARAESFSEQVLIEAAIKIRDMYAKATWDGGLGIGRVPTTKDPLKIVLDNSIEDPLYGSVMDKIYLDLEAISNSNMANPGGQQTLAHEMFHWIEKRKYPLLIQGGFNTEFVWQMETRAEMASFLINPQYQTAELIKKGATWQSESNQILGWQANAFDWATDQYLGIKAAVEPARYVQGITARMGLCISDETCNSSVATFAKDTNEGTLLLYNDRYGVALPNTARYLLGFTPDVDYENHAVDFAVPQLQTGRGIGDFIHASMLNGEFIGLSCIIDLSNLHKSIETGVVQINANIGRQAIFPLRVSNGADYPLDSGAYTGKRAQPNVPFSLRIEAGVPFFYRQGSGELIERDGKEATVIEPITSEAMVKIQGAGGTFQNVAGIPVVRLVAMNNTTAGVTLRGTFAPMDPLFSTNPQRLKVTSLSAPYDLTIDGERIFPKLESFYMLIDYQDGSMPISLRANLQPDGSVQVTDTHIFRKQGVVFVTVAFKDASGSSLGWPDLLVPVDSSNSDEIRPAFNMAGVEIIFGNTNYNPNYSYQNKSIVWSGLSFSTTPDQFMQGTVSNDYKSITLSLKVDGHTIQLNDIPRISADNIYKTYVYRLNGAAAILQHALEDGGTPNWVPESGFEGLEYVNISLVQYPR